MTSNNLQCETLKQSWRNNT